MTFTRAALVSFALYLAPATPVRAQRALPPSADASMPPLRRLDGSTLSLEAADAIVRAQVQQHQIKGLQVAVVNDGQLAWSAAYGVRATGDSAGSAPRSADLTMQRTTTTWAASITKAIFATYVMQLVERDEIALDTPIARQLPQPLNRYASYSEKGAAIVKDPLWDRVTLRMLLSHTSGLANFATMEADGAMRLHHEPGARYRYSGEGINLAGFLIEQKFGKSLDLLMREAIFQPLGMARTDLTFREPFASDIADRFGAEGQFLSKTRRTAARAAGSMTSSADDLATFAIALLHDRVISSALRRAMLTPQIAITAPAQFGPESLVDGGEEGPRLGLSYGLGWGLLQRTAHGPAFFKEGHGDGAQTYLLCFERQKSCLVLLANSDNGELAFRPLVNALLGTDDIPWRWEGYTPEQIREAQRRGPGG